MNGHFLRIHSLHGELKRSLKRKNLGVTVSTEQLVFQQPYVNYYIMLRDIVSIVPYRNDKTGTYRFVNRNHSQCEITSGGFDSNDRYTFYVKRAVIHNVSGLKEIGPVRFVMPVHREMLQDIARYSQLNAFP
jgi:hypothetical protein